jgi:predicted DsbA family dithiol-disulfide isomerase
VSAEHWPGGPGSVAGVRPGGETRNLAPVLIKHYTDPSCPWAFSAERQRLRLLWLYGEQIDWELHMVVLSEEVPEDFTPERLSAAYRGLAMRYGMPIDWRERIHVAPSVHACRAVVAVRLRWPEREAAMLRRLRVLNFAGELLDDSDTLELAAEQAGLPVKELAQWAAAPEVEQALRADMLASRSPSPASRAQDYKLGGPGEERRYTCPSYELLRNTEPPADWPTARRVDLPGFRPVEAYEAAIANLAPELTRRADPETPAEVLAWAGVPLATAEVAAVMDRETDDVRGELARSARFEPVGVDGYWSRT